MAPIVTLVSGKFRKLQTVSLPRDRCRSQSRGSAATAPVNWTKAGLRLRPSTPTNKPTALLRQIGRKRRAEAAEWVQILRRPRLQVGVHLVVEQRRVVGEVVAGLRFHGRLRS